MTFLLAKKIEDKYEDRQIDRQINRWIERKRQRERTRDGEKKRRKRQIKMCPDIQQKKKTLGTNKSNRLKNFISVQRNGNMTERYIHKLG